MRRSASPKFELPPPAKGSTRLPSQGHAAAGTTRWRVRHVAAVRASVVRFNRLDQCEEILPRPADQGVSFGMVCSPD